MNELVTLAKESRIVKAEKGSETESRLLQAGWIRAEQPIRPPESEESVPSSEPAAPAVLESFDEDGYLRVLQPMTKQQCRDHAKAQFGIEVDGSKAEIVQQIIEAAKQSMVTLSGGA